LPIAAGDALIVYDGEHDDRNPPRRGSLEDRQGAGQRLFGFDRAFGLAVHDGLVAALGRETPIGPALSRGEVRSSAASCSRVSARSENLRMWRSAARPSSP
jgi:hypothetical protein